MSEVNCDNAPASAPAPASAKRECLELITKAHELNRMREATHALLRENQIDPDLIPHVQGYDSIDKKLGEFSQLLNVAPQRSLDLISVDIEKVKSTLIEIKSSLEKIPDLSGDDWLSSYFTYAAAQRVDHMREIECRNMQMALEREYELAKNLAELQVAIGHDSMYTV